MDLEYDLKFEDMKKYIPFLESMIKRLESTSSASANPRQAQLDKIRSLRDLLLDKKKRMKMENLLKCEQVLVNLYAKVEQRDALPGIKSVTDPAYQSNSKAKEDDLEVVRNKLKSVTTKRLDEEQDTLPEIARASITEELCTPGSKEPALFQRRPNKASLSPVRGTQKSPIIVPQTISKRNYTRVLISPEPSTNNSKRWDSEEIISEKPLFSRRSPRPSPKNHSPTYHKKEKKKSKLKKGRDLNITLNVPEESLDSLNTTDILSRIMTCSDSDVDIETLREAKRQILNELQHTGANCDDISDLLLKSYKKKSNKLKRKDDVEEGELSDSESEAIESIYGGFMLDVDKNKSKGNDSENKEKPRKIQICLVINSDKEEHSKEFKEDLAKPNEPDLSDFVMFDDKTLNTNASSSITPATEAAATSKVNTSIGEKETPEQKTNNKTLITSKTDKSQMNQIPSDIKHDTVVVQSKADSNASLVESAKPANFYKPIHEQTTTAVAALEMTASKQPEVACNANSKLSGRRDDAENLLEIAAFLQGSSETDAKSQVEIPLLNEPSVARHKPKEDVISEIDILQALKNEILSESLTVTETITPALHQPKLTKVSSVQEIVPKKRISIEKYKEKSVSVPKTVTPLFFQDPGHQSKDDHSKKQSLKLTMKECERFNFPTKLSLGEEDVSDEDNDVPTSLDDIYTDIGPKSPDIKDVHNSVNKAPVIIPADPIKSVVIPSKADVDMRAMHPKVPSGYAPALRSEVSSEVSAFNTMKKDELKTNNDQNRLPFDPRMRRDLNQTSKIETSPHPHTMTPNRLQPVPPSMNYANMTQNMGSIMAPKLSSCISPMMTSNSVPNMTPNLNMTPNRNPNMTPNVRTYELNNMDENSSSKHVYAPFFPVYDQRENREKSVVNETVQSPCWEIKEKDIRKSRWDSSWETTGHKDINQDGRWESPDNNDIHRDPRSTSLQSETPDYHNSRFNDSYSGYKNSRYNTDRRDSFNRQDCPQTPIPSFGRSEVQIPQPFGRLDAPRTPVHPFGRSECPSTPNHPFSRGDCPPTPSHTFGRGDCPPTPSHTFGRGDCPPTPSHTFGRGDMPVTPSHPFGRSDNYVRDPRLNRSSDYDNSQRDDRDRNNYRDRNSSHYNSYKQDGKRSYTNSDSYRNFREQSVGMNDRNRYLSNDQSIRKYDKKEHMSRREASVGRTLHEEQEKERLYSRESRSVHRERYSGPSDGGSHRSSLRATSVGKNFHPGETDKKLSVKPHVGCSFTIDTSVNSTFQGFIDSDKKRPEINHGFDARRQRAASVGRSLCRESSIGRSLGRESSIDRSFKPEDSGGKRLKDRSWPTDKSSSHFLAKSKKNNFRRACSVGRDIIGVNAGKSLKDIKADFESYKLNYDTKYKKAYVDDNRKSEKKLSSHESSMNKSSPRNKTKKHNIKHTDYVGKKPYSPKKNYRDPRLRRELPDDKNKHKGYNYKVCDKKHVGIVYSNDNITKGTIMGSGYGVKNYKIPKIKRPAEEKKQDKDVIETTDKTKVEKSNKHIIKEPLHSGDKKVKSSKSSSKVEPVIVMSDIEENTEKRVTRSNRKSGNQSLLSDDDDYKTKTRKSKKNFIYDTDSDTEAEEKEENSAICEIKAKKTIEHKTNSNKDIEKNKYTTSKCKNVEPKPQIGSKIQVRTGVTKEIVDSKGSSSPQTLKENINIDSDHSSFEIEDLEIFSDNIASDPVIDDNINALIADLDNDLEPSKIVTPTEFSNEMTIENILESMTGEANDDKVMTEDLNDISEVIKNDLKETTDRIEMESFQKPSIPGNDSKNTESVKDQINVTSNKTQNHESISNKIEENEDSVKDQVNDAENVPKNYESTGDKEDDHKIIAIEKTRSISVIESKCPNGLMEKLIEPSKKNNDKNTLSSENIVSTTKLEKDNLFMSAGSQIEEPTQLDRSSTPDSTNENIKSKQDESLPDSTNEVQNETYSVVTSSRDSVDPTNKDNTEPSSSNKDVNPLLNNIENLFSLLQDKTKIKQVLSMLGDQSSENEKIKKKLEKLSEIVSDEEDTKDESENLNINEKDTKDLSEQVNDVSESDGASLKEQNEALDYKLKELGQPAQSEDKKEDTDSKSIAHVDNNVASNLKETIKKRNTKVVKKIPAKKGRVAKKGKLVKKVANEPKRVTRSGGANLPSIDGIKIKKPNRELQKLQEDIKEMFISDDVLNATGIRMCRLAKLVDDKTTKFKDDCSSQDSSGPMVVLEELKKSVPEFNENPSEKGGKKKVSLKPETGSKMVKPSPKYKPGPKSKKKSIHKSDDEDPYAFETDSVSEHTIRSTEGKEQGSSDSEGESLASFKSYESADVLLELKKKPKRKRPGWQAGIIKKNKRKKPDIKTTETPLNDDILVPVQTKTVPMPDMSCFTDKTYCFHKNVFTYSCRLCVYTGDEIVNHYKQQHPHSEIPLSRLSPDMAKEAIEQCEEINFQAISKIPTEKYVCRFCFKEFSRKNAVLEAFFWHIVSMHTGEYKQLCSLCVNITRCPFNLDIPPPPKDVKGQLIGYICEKCNFTQISLENLKTHVIVRHNDEQTEVYTINLAAMSKKTINSLLKQCSAPIEEKPRVLRSSRSNQSMTEASDDHSDITDSDAADEPLALRRKRIKDICSPPDIKPPKINYLSKITFESDVNHGNKKKMPENRQVKIEREDEDTTENPEASLKISAQNVNQTNSNAEETITESTENKSDDIFAYPHFKISYSNTGSKEYVCCINGKDGHYKTPLLISMKKHVQTKHNEIWDGYCFLCKVIVTPQGNHHFKDCLQHYLDKHMDNFPVLENIHEETEKLLEAAVKQIPPTKPYINVRPMSELVSGESVSSDELPTLPKIESVVSLGAQTVEPPEISPSYPSALTESPQAVKEFKYEEIQAEVMTKKHRVVLDTMMSHHKLLNVFKCAGRFCSFTTDSAEDALLHASTHQRVGGEKSLMCAYCDFDCSGNAIDLVMHVFNSHNECPYVCGHCFYRAAASQVVAAHINRVHDSMPMKVLASPNPVSLPTQVSSMLPRKDVVLYYVCPHACKFRTYTAGKYCEHLLQRHSDEQWHSCYLCSQNHSSPTNLIMHLKTHELNLYQCPWCLHGADTEATLLYHTSQKHPNKQPQAYLRVITNKDGSSEYRVLPLASFNKSKVAITTVPPIVSNENPAREAERSIELEKLIGHTDLMIESMAATSPAATKHPNTEIEVAVANITIPEAVPDPQEPVVTTVSEPLPVVTDPPRLETPPPVEKDKSQQVTPKIKLEPMDQTPTKNISSEVIYCLDSDDEDSRQSIIALSDDDSASSSSVPQSKLKQDGKKQIITRPLLYKCAKCSLIFKNSGGFKRHLNSCYGSARVFNCAHCEDTFYGRDQLVNHYTRDHCEGTSNKCGVCSKPYNAMPLVKRHMKLVHKVSKYIVSSNHEDGEFVYTLYPAPVAPKRKLSSASSEPPAKMKRFGPQDIDQLPINPILDESVFCSLCEFQTKVRLNMVRHLQFHAEQQPVPQTAPVNPVPHLETNEKHFDRMVNLASSSIVTRAPDKSTRTEPTTTVSLLIPPEAASRYPKYVPDRQRLTCGAIDCSYISVDDAMLKYHWETLHSGSNDFHCVHCPPYQHLDTTKPLTAARIIGHLKMHDSTLYACSACPYYHYKKLVVDKHISELHKGNGRLMVVREELAISPVPTVSQPSVSAPTMDLKPWQCGLCSFKSMLRPEVVEHCAKLHQSKMQYKCAYCPFRTSAIENVTKHQSNSHPGKKEEIFYYYYREGSTPDEDDGIPRWMRQRQKMNPEPEVKSEVGESRNASLAQLLAAPQKPVSSISTPEVDLNIVKKEVEEEIPDNASLEKLCSKYGQFCEPNGLKYKCPLCKVVVEDSKEAMQSHLYEELKYRKWACAICTYKAFHKTGLKDHVISEHRGKNPEPSLLPLDNNIENWVAGLLDHQFKSITKSKENLVKQKILTERPTPAPSMSSEKNQNTTAEKPSDKFSMDELEQAFGQLGAPSNMSFSCPKCSYRSKDEVAMRDHLEGELTRIRWCCSSCTDNFQNYHEAQFHCKSVHTGLSARPKEAVRDPSMRSSWVSAVIQVQRLSMKGSDTSSEKELIDVPDSVDNSLLVVRYEERVSTSEEPVVLRKRPAPDSDDERLVIDEPQETSAVGALKCNYCNYQSKYAKILKEHMFSHFNTKPYNCKLCGFNGHRKTLKSHLALQHKEIGSGVKVSQYIEFAVLPGGETSPLQKAKPKKVAEDLKIEPKVVCLLCDKGLTEAEMEIHSHENEKPMFAKKGDVVVKCCICLALRIDICSLQEHHNLAHPNEPINYAFYKMMHETRETLCCGHCNNRFRFIRDLRSHHEAAHPSLEVEYSTIPYTSESSTSIPDSDDDMDAEKSKSVDSVPSGAKRVARKSTSKLPPQTVAKKSTTKLPFNVEDFNDEFTYYGTKPEPLDRHRNVTTRMSLCNTIMPVSMKQLSELFKINPSVVLEDCRKGRSSLQ